MSEKITNHDQDPSTQDSTGWEEVANFEGETNINRATGKKRSYALFDIYPYGEKNKDGKTETKSEYGERLKRMMQISKEAEAAEAERERLEAEEKAKQDYLNSEFGQRETAATAEYDRLEAKIRQAVEDGKFTNEHANALLEKHMDKAIDVIDGARQNYQDYIEGIRQDEQDRQTVGPEEDQKNYQEWLKKHEEENRQNLENTNRSTQTDEERAKAEAEARAKAEAEERARHEAEARAKHEAEERAKAEAEARAKGKTNTPENPNSEPEDPEKAQERRERLEELGRKERMLNRLRSELAERYAKNRSIIPGYRNKTDFLEKSEKYATGLDDFLRSKLKIAFEDDQNRISQELQGELDRLNSEDGDYEEKKQKLIDFYDEKMKEAENKIKEQFTKDYVDQSNLLEQETIDRLDNGNVIRKLVHAFRSNKKVKVAIAAAAVAGLGAAFVASGGMGAGALTIGYKLTGTGMATGAIKGAIAGFLSSRQDSSTSEIRGFAKMNEQAIRDKLSEIFNQNQESTLTSETKGVAGWITGEYEKSNNQDYYSDLKKSAIGAGLGAFSSLVMSGVQIGRSTVEMGKPVKIGNIPDAYEVDLSKVNIPKGHGAYDTFTQLGGDPSKFQQALNIMSKLDAQSNGQFVYGSNGVVPGHNGLVGNYAHTYQGPIKSWPKAAQVYIKAVTNEWAKAGLIEPTQVIEGGPIFAPTFHIVQNYVKTGLAQFLAGAIGGNAVGGAGSTINRTSPNRINSEPIQTTTPQGEAIPGVEEIEEVFSPGELDSILNNNPNRDRIQRIREAEARRQTLEADAAKINQELQQNHNVTINLPPEPTPEPAPGSTPESQPTPDEYNLTPEQLNQYRSRNNAERINRIEYRNNLKAILPGLTDEDINILSAPSSEQSFSPENLINYRRIWDSLPDDNTRNRVKEYVSNNTQNTGFKGWVTNEKNV